MPRKGNVPKREVLPDPMYGSKVVTKLINNLMIDGKKGKAQTIVYDAFAMIAEKNRRRRFRSIQYCYGKHNACFRS